MPGEVSAADRMPGLEQVHVWGPLSDLADTSTMKASTALACMFRRLMEYICGNYIDQLRDQCSGGSIYACLMGWIITLLYR
jgi:hypothetical protein